MTPFQKLGAMPATAILGGNAEGHYAHLTGVTIGELSLRAGTVIPMHAHPHEQITYLISGRFEFTVGDETQMLEPGMVVLIPSGATHGGTTQTDCVVVDVFCPVREDYRVTT